MTAVEVWIARGRLLLPIFFFQERGSEEREREREREREKERGREICTTLLHLCGYVCMLMYTYAYMTYSNICSLMLMQVLEFIYKYKLVYRERA